MRDYYVVDTAFQLLCAIEARAEFGTGRESHLVIDARGGADGRERNLDQMRALIDADWHSVSYNIYPRKKGARRSLVRFRAALATRLRHGRAARLFCGIASDKWVRLYGRLYGAAQVIRTDDGTATIFALRDLRARAWAPDAPLEAYSIFAHSGDPGVIRQNPLRRLSARRRTDQRITAGLVWLIGGAYSETAVLSAEDELHLFTAIRNRYAGHVLQYLPHRDDSDEKLARLRDMGLSIAAHGPNLETRLLEASELPAEIAGIASTALFTARLLQPDLRVCALRSPLIVKPGYELIYQEAARHGIVVTEAG